MGRTDRDYLELSRLPLILRCVVVGAACACVIVGVAVAINVISNYPTDHVVQVMLFGMFEAAVVGGILGSVLGLVVGVLAYLTRGAIRSVPHRRS